MMIPELPMMSADPGTPHADALMFKHKSNRSSYFIDSSSMDNKVVSITKTETIHNRDKKIVYRIVTIKRQDSLPSDNVRGRTRAGDALVVKRLDYKSLAYRKYSGLRVSPKS